MTPSSASMTMTFSETMETKLQGAFKLVPAKTLWEDYLNFQNNDDSFHSIFFGNNHNQLKV